MKERREKANTAFTESVSDASKNSKILCCRRRGVEARREHLETLFGIIHGNQVRVCLQGEGTGVSDKVVSGSAHSATLC